MFIFMNVLSFLIVLTYAAHCGWLGETIQYKLTVRNINLKYDRELLLSLALVQAGKGSVEIRDSGLITIQTENNKYIIYADDYASDSFGTCYYSYSGNVSVNINGNITLKTRKYLRDFKEQYLGIIDPSSVGRTKFTFKKQKVTIE